MLTISHSVDIDVPPKDVWTWLSELPDHYLDWHPAHRECRLIQGELWEPSAVLEVQEELHGRLHRLRFQVTSVSPGREVTYRTGRWFRGRFVIEPTDGHSRFTAELSFGLPGIGRLPTCSGTESPQPISTSVKRGSTSSASSKHPGIEKRSPYSSLRGISTV